MTQNKVDLKWVWMPALLTLVITLVRMFGELNDLDPSFFGSEAGGTQGPAAPGVQPAPSLFGIFWLIPVMGVYFAVRLLRGGVAPAHRGAAILLPLLGLAVFFGAFALLLVTREHDAGVPVRSTGFLYGLAGVGVVGWAAALLAGKGWPGLRKLSMCYGFAARVPVIVITYILCPLGTGTHYEKLAPFAPEGMSVWSNAFWLSLAQLGVWIPLTILLGSLCGGIASLVVRPRASA